MPRIAIHQDDGHPSIGHRNGEVGSHRARTFPRIRARDHEHLVFAVTSGEQGRQRLERCGGAGSR